MLNKLPSPHLSHPGLRQGAVPAVEEADTARRKASFLWAHTPKNSVLCLHGGHRSNLRLALWELSVHHSLPTTQGQRLKPPQKGQWELSLGLEGGHVSWGVGDRNRGKRFDIHMYLKDLREGRGVMNSSWKRSGSDLSPPGPSLQTEGPEPAALSGRAGCRSREALQSDSKLHAS